MLVGRLVRCDFDESITYQRSPTVEENGEFVEVLCIWYHLLALSLVKSTIRPGSVATGRDLHRSIGIEDPVLTAYGVSGAGAKAIVILSAERSRVALSSPALPTTTQTTPNHRPSHNYTRSTASPNSSVEPSEAIPRIHERASTPSSASAVNSSR